MSRPVFVDSSVWIDFFRNAGGRAAAALGELLETDQAVIGKIIIAEIVPFVKNTGEQNKIRDLFQNIPILPFEADDWDVLIDLSRQLCKKGLTPTIPDLVIATLCLRHSVSLYTYDGHFNAFAKTVPLKLIQPE